MLASHPAHTSLSCSYTCTPLLPLAIPRNICEVRHLEPSTKNSVVHPRLRFALCAPAHATPPYLSTHALILVPLRSTPIQGCIYYLPSSEDPLQRLRHAVHQSNPACRTSPPLCLARREITRCTTDAPPHAKSRLAYPLDCVADYPVCICIPHNVIVTRLIIHSSVQCLFCSLRFQHPLDYPATGNSPTHLSVFMLLSTEIWHFDSVFI